MPDILVQVVLGSTSHLPADVVVNTWHFEVANPIADSALDDIKSRLLPFYSYLGANDILSEKVDAQTSRIKMYALGDPKPRVPRHDSAFIYTQPGGKSLPTEVALCLSFRGQLNSGEKAARRRNRVFLGPLSVGTQDTVDGSKPKNATCDAIRSRAQLLMSLNANNATKWIVWSPTIDKTVVPDGGDWAGTPVINGWVDNAYDTQRRRGQKATVRQTF